MVTPASTGDVTGREKAKAAIEEVQTSLREDILSGKLAPRSRLPIEALRAQFGVSSSTLREALSRLMSENLVTAELQRGFHVAPISISDFREITQMRIALETLGIAESIKHGDDAWEARVVAANHRLARIESGMVGGEEFSPDEWELRDRGFHDALVSGFTNGWLMKLRNMLYVHSVRYTYISFSQIATGRDVRAEHQAIFYSVIARDVDRAVRLTREHIAGTIPIIEARLASLDTAE